MSTSKPLIGIPADRRLLGDHYFHCVGENSFSSALFAAFGNAARERALKDRV